MEDIDIRALNEKINLIQNVKNSKAYYQVMNDLRIVRGIRIYVLS